jgi:dTDP-4-amino-4,6-dideoxygalactose transaminase
MKPRLYLSPPHMSLLERELLLEAFDSNWIAPLGPYVDQFEADLSRRLEARPVCVTSSGTAALHLVLMLLGVGPGDDVLVPSLTFAATANAVRYVGASPILVDAEQETWAISPPLVEEYFAACLRTGRALPKAVISVDLYGQPANYAELRRIVEPLGVPLIQDAAEALGSFYRGQPVGVQGDYAVLSFNGNKIITTSGGGALVATDPEFVAHARKLASQAREPFSHYEHTEIGYNYRLSNLLAALGVAQLRSLEEKVAARRAHHHAYQESLGGLRGVRLFDEPEWARSNYWLTVATVDPDEAGYSRDDVLEALAVEDIEARPTWKPMHLQPVFLGAQVLGGEVSERIFREGLCLPSGSAMSEADRERVVQGVLRMATNRARPAR